MKLEKSMTQGPKQCCGPCLPAKFAVVLAVFITSLSMHAGTLSYVPITPTGSDNNSGISSNNGYTTAVDGGNATGTPRVINGITLDVLVGSGDSVTADNCTLTALSGTLSSASGAVAPVPADGVLAATFGDMTSNSGAENNSQQEIVLDPESLTPGMTYDLRIYVRSSSTQDRRVSLSFVGDGQAPAETGFFNEDDARTSSGAFTDPNQVYYINYRFTWDGKSTPGVTITQASGEAPFLLYALTNQIAGTAAPSVAAVATPAQAPAQTGITTGLTTETADDVGVTSDTFYADESLKRNGRWIKAGNYGTAWQPTKVSRDWRPYTNGSWRYADDYGWTWVTDEDWGWATYHYGRWARLEGVGWVWVPGTTWGASWVSWRRGNTSAGELIGWAPLPPETTVSVNIGVSSWVDNVYGIGPDAYSFLNLVDFGMGSYRNRFLDRRRFINVFQQTENITNITYVNNTYINNTYVNNAVFAGGPDFAAANAAIRRNKGQEIGKIYVDRFADPAKMQTGQRSRLDGDKLSLAAPNVTKGVATQTPVIATNIPANKVDHGWNGIKDAKTRDQLKDAIAKQNSGQTPITKKATLPADVKVGTGPAPGGSPTGTPPQFGQGDKGKRSIKGADVTGQTLGQPVTGASPTGALGGKGIHPGQPIKGLNVGATQATGASSPGPSPVGAAGGNVIGGKGKRHPGDSLQQPGNVLSGQPGLQTGATATPIAGASPTGPVTTVTGKQKGLKGNAQVPMQPNVTGSTPAPVGQVTGPSPTVAGKLPTLKGKQPVVTTPLNLPGATATPQPTQPSLVGPTGVTTGKGKKPGKLTNVPQPTGATSPAPVVDQSQLGQQSVAGPTGVTTGKGKKPGKLTKVPPPTGVAPTSPVVDQSQVGAGPQTTGGPTPIPLEKHTKKATGLKQTTSTGPTGVGATGSSATSSAQINQQQQALKLEHAQKQKELQLQKQAQLQQQKQLQVQQKQLQLQQKQQQVQKLQQPPKPQLQPKPPPQPVRVPVNVKKPLPTPTPVPH
ncbi:MAG: DUF6600 domain-containing protein [Chthoniobacterales bacterium]